MSGSGLRYVEFVSEGDRRKKKAIDDVNFCLEVMGDQCGKHVTSIRLDGPLSRKRMAIFRFEEVEAEIFLERARSVKPDSRGVRVTITELTAAELASRLRLH